MPSDLDNTFDLINLKRALRWTFSNPEPTFKNYFRDLYKAYATADEEHLRGLKDKFSRSIYEPTDSFKVYFPKKSGILRPFTLLSIEDQIVYQALMNVVADKLFPKVRKRYLKETFGHLYAGKSSKFFYRKWQDGYKKFRDSIRKAYSDGFVYRAFFDLTACYDSIDHNVLKYFLNELYLDTDFTEFLLNCLRHWTKTSPQEQIFQGHGIPQGPQPSGLLAEVILSHFDNKRSSVRKIKYFRYVDDIRLYAKDEHHLRHMLVELDLLSKSIGLFPQSSKVDIRRVTNIEGELKSISNPPEPVSIKAGNQTAIRKRLKELTKNYKINDETRFKWVLAQADPSISISRRLLRIVREYPHLYVSIFSYFHRYKVIPDEISRQLFNLLKEEDLYPSFSATLLRSVLGKIPADIVPVYIRHIKRLFNERDKIGYLEIGAEACIWLLQNKELTYDKTFELATSRNNWWLRMKIINFVDKSYIGTPSYENLLNSLVKDSNVDVSIMAAYLLSIEGLDLFSPRRGINPMAEILLKEFGIISRTTAVSCGIAYAFNSVVGNALSGISWRSIFGSKYTEAERKLIRSKGYFKTDPTAWVNIMDTFNDLMLGALFEHDDTIGTYTLGNIGGVLNKNSRFARKYPKLFKMVKNIHDKRLASDLSHARTRQTGKSTRPVEFQYLDKAKKMLIQAFIELKRKW